MIDNFTLIFMASMFFYLIISLSTFPKELRFERDAFVSFCVFMLIVVMIRICLMSFLKEAGIYSEKSIDFPFKVWRLGMVWWEDLCFVLPLFIVKKYTNSKIIFVPLVILSSVLFASGHLYQGLFGLITVIYPYFISYRYGVKYGLGTVMVCHVLYDFIVFYLMKYIGVLIG